MKQLHKWNEIRRANSNPEREARVKKRVENTLLEMSLGDLRRELGVTQSDMAKAAEMTQGDVSRLENSDNFRIATLRRAVRALGGEIEVIAVVGSKRVKMTV